MNLIYSFYIFMIIVKVSNSINQNYAVIYYDNHFAYDYLYVNGLIYFAPYRHTIHQFDQQQIDPQDYFLSIHNPYYYFIPSPSPTSGFEDHIDSVSRELNHYKKKNIIFSLTASSYELRLSGIDPKYWHKRPKFYTLNLNITNACILYNLSCNYGENVEDFKTEMNHIQYQYALDSQDIVTFDKVIEKKTDDAFTVVPKFYIIKNNEYDTLRKLMKYLPFKGETTEEYMNRYEPGPPKSEETIDDYLDRHEDTVKYYFYLNKNLSGHFQNYPIQTMSIDRVKNLKLPYLLRFESYNIYVLRMKTMGIVPFHLDFFKKKYKLFLDWKQVTIFEELGVDLKKNVTLELTTSGQ